MAYYDQIVTFGGERMTRGHMIAELQRLAPNQACVDRYLQGHDRGNHMSLSDERLEPGYAMTSTRRHPREPETVIVPEDAVKGARCIGRAKIDDNSLWLCFKVPGERRYWFQYRPRAFGE